jgi:hypothetical protein
MHWMLKMWKLMELVKIEQINSAVCGENCQQTCLLKPETV